MLIKNFKKLRSSISLVKIAFNRFNSTSSQNLFKYEIVNPESFSLIKRSFPSHIQLPVYAENGSNDDHIFEDKILDYKNLSRDQTVIEGVKTACKIAKQILQNVKQFIKVTN